MLPCYGRKGEQVYLLKNNQTILLTPLTKVFLLSKSNDLTKLCYMLMYQVVLYHMHTILFTAEHNKENYISNTLCI